MNNYFKECLQQVLEMKGQDLFLKVGTKPRIRLGGKVIPLKLREPSSEDMENIIKEQLSGNQLVNLEKEKSIDFAFSLSGINFRFRGNAFFQGGCLSLVVRLLWDGIPTFEELQLPPVLKQAALEKSGIILIGGAVSSGKTTSIAAMIDAMNKSVERHIITIEDPVEYIHKDNKCLIEQREIGQDANDFNSALKYVVRQSPDVIVIGEMRDADTFNFALAAAEIGRLVISTVHAQSTTQIFDRILGFFKPEHRETILRHFAFNMTCLAVQKLLVSKDEVNLAPAVEVLLGNYTLRQLVIEKKLDKIPQALRNAAREGMQTMDQSLIKLWQDNVISGEVALGASSHPQDLENLMKGIKIGHEGKILGT